MLLFSTNVILMEIEKSWIYQAAPHLLKALAILSDTTVKISVVIWEDLKPAASFWVIKNSINYKFFKGFTNHWKKTNRMVVFGCRTFSNILKYRDHQRDFPTIWKTRLIQTTYWRIQLVYTKVQVHSSLGPPMECNQDQTRHIKVCYELFNNLGSYRNI